MTIPNLISILRLFLVPVTIWLISTEKTVWAFFAFVLAGVSDAVDGFLARQFDMGSALGAYLDPLADKALLVSIYVTFAVLNEIPVWLPILVVSRDFLIIGGVLLAWMLGVPVTMRPRIISKANTLAQITLAALVLGDLAFPGDLSALRSFMVYLVGALTLASAVVYAIDWLRHMGADHGPGARNEAK
ncbi:MAG: CDP-alcohol phosphatidyltransferase family protein [Rhizobiales bacterium]|nr:CDP-alcohol phosphatidyltransferase family protein [Hyphomicrobiales bacterium]MBN9010519.1 CDP-alcohol phosphatidyltransferase family protein [Hyphomicrobiales bacterium]